MGRIAITLLNLLLIGISAAGQNEATPQQQPTATPSNPVPGLPGVGVDLGLDASGKVGAVLVYEGGKQTQVLPVCTAESVPRGDPVGTIATADYNFDGYSDLALQVASKDGNASYCIWLFDPKTRSFVPSKELSELTNPRPDPNTRTVISYKKEGCFGSCYEKETYTWSNGRLVPVKYESQTQPDPAAANTGGCIYLLTVKEEKNGQLVEVSRNRVNDMGAQCGPVP